MGVLSNDLFLKRVEEVLKAHTDKNEGTVWFTMKKLTSPEPTAAVDDSKHTGAVRRVLRLRARAKAAQAVAAKTGTPEARTAAETAAKAAAQASFPPTVNLLPRRRVPTAILYRVTDGSKSKSTTISTVVVPEDLRAFNGAFCFLLRQGCTALKKTPAPKPRFKPTTTARHQGAAAGAAPAGRAGRDD